MEYTTTLADKRPVVITIGNFDGIHLGHQQLLRELQQLADELASTPVLVTFSPHTLMVIRPDIDLQCLTTIEEKLGLAQRYSHIAESIVVHFTPEVAAMSATAFMDELRANFSLRGLVVGENFSLGRNRMGNVDFLMDYGQQHQVVVRSIPLTESTQERISSTRIRALITAGAVREASELLGHPHLAQGTIVHGDERGRQIGFPTANIRPELHKLLPANGVYAVHAHVPGDATDHSTVYKGVANIGIRPTFNGRERLLEVHILDMQLDLYGRSMTVEFLDYLRSEQRFAGIAELKAQIATDVQKARQILTIGE